MKVIFLILMVMVLSACTTTKYVDRVEYRYPDTQWVKPVAVAAPPSQSQFQEADLNGRLEMLGSAYMQQTTRLGMCNGQLNTIELWMIDSKTRSE